MVEEAKATRLKSQEGNSEQQRQSERTEEEEMEEDGTKTASTRCLPRTQE